MLVGFVACLFVVPCHAPRGEGVCRRASEVARCVVRGSKRDRPVVLLLCFLCFCLFCCCFHKQRVVKPCMCSNLFCHVPLSLPMSKCFFLCLYEMGLRDFPPVPPHAGVPMFVAHVYTAKPNYAADDNAQIICAVLFAGFVPRLIVVVSWTHLCCTDFQMFVRTTATSRPRQQEYMNDEREKREKRWARVRTTYCCTPFRASASYSRTFLV